MLVFYRFTFVLIANNRNLWYYSEYRWRHSYFHLNAIKSQRTHCCCCCW